ncbi:MAG: riboflavin synthase [Melioribacter sp.]|uniref:riboflavin synthase n=1 Tax=Rosettibacter primus TaxID=3111523 RepID=UPI00247EA7F1|nr:riboflavin synthase [Melioribacter sp.]
MFSGIIEEIGQIQKIDFISGGIKLTISANKILEDVKIGDSVSVDGICLTITSFNKNSFTVDAVGETLKKTTLSTTKNKSYVNLERAIRFNERIGGHLIQGHINSTAKITQLKKIGENFLLQIELPDDLMKYIIKEGSIAVDGISLTVADIIDNKINISIIPHTWQNTTLKYKKGNDLVNIEVDFTAKYIENFIKNYLSQKNEISEEMLKKLGY